MANEAKVNTLTKRIIDGIFYALDLTEGFDWREPEGREPFYKFRTHMPAIPCHAAPRCRSFKGDALFLGKSWRRGYCGPEMRAQILHNGALLWVPESAVVLDIPALPYEKMRDELTTEEYRDALIDAGFPFVVVDLTKASDAELDPLLAWARTKKATEEEAFDLACYVAHKKYFANIY